MLKLILSGESEQVERKEQLKNKKSEVCLSRTGSSSNSPIFAPTAVFCRFRRSVSGSWICHRQCVMTAGPISGSDPADGLRPRQRRQFLQNAGTPLTCHSMRGVTEQELSLAWATSLGGGVSAIRAFGVTTAFSTLAQRAAAQTDARIVLVDVGPNLGAINRAVMIASDYVVIPLAPDLCSLQGLRNLGPTLSDWRQDWASHVSRKPDPGLEAPAGEMRPRGYVVRRRRTWTSTASGSSSTTTRSHRWPKRRAGRCSCCARLTERSGHTSRPCMMPTATSRRWRRGYWMQSVSRRVTAAAWPGIRSWRGGPGAGKARRSRWCPRPRRHWAARRVRREAARACRRPPARPG